MGKRRSTGCREFEGLLPNTSKTSIMYLPIWSELEQPFAEKNLTGAGTR